MQIKTHEHNKQKIAEIIAEEVVVNSIDDALELIGNLYYEGYEKIIISENNITADFFNLKTKLAGEILQKFAQYQMPLVIVGDFEKYNSNSLRDFIYESNKGKQINFVANINEIL